MIDTWLNIYHRVNQERKKKTRSTAVPSSQSLSLANKSGFIVAVFNLSMTLLTVDLLRTVLDGKLLPASRLIVSSGLCVHSNFQNVSL